MEVIVLIFLALFNICENANILVIMPSPSKSHFIVVERLLRELSVRGHNVDVHSFFPRKHVLPRYRDCNLKGSLPDMVNNLNVTRVNRDNPLDDFTNMMAFSGSSFCEAILSSPCLCDLKHSNEMYDLLITDLFTFNCMLGFAHLFKIPTVGISTSINMPWTSSYVGMPDNPSYIPNYYVPYSPNMCFLERVMNTFFYLVTIIGFKLISNTNSNIVAKNFFGTTLPDLDYLAHNISLILVNSHFSIHQARPVVPNFQEVAGLHIEENLTLPAHLKEFLDTNHNGVIYLSLGSMVSTEMFPENKLEAFFQAFKKIPYKVLWKGTREKFPKHLEIPKNIQFESWMPQIGILCHPNVKLFISHGGMLGTLEAIYCGVPILGMPLFADQRQNVKNIVTRRIGVEVAYQGLTEKSILAALALLLENPMFKENMRKTSILFRDKPSSPLDTAIYWVEYVIRHKGAPHLRSAGADLPLHQYYLLDIIGFFLVLTLLLIYLIYKALKYILNCNIFKFYNMATKNKQS